MKPYNVVKQSLNIKFDESKLNTNEENLQLFFAIMYERQMIWKRRFIECSESPWTKDPIFLNYKFCNLYRELDRSCQWEIRNIILDESLDLKNLVWKIMVYRTFNNPETFARGLEKWKNGIPDYEDYDIDEFAQHISEVREAGINPFTNAYSIAGSVVIGESIDDQYTRTVIPSIHDNLEVLMTLAKNAKAPEQIVSFLMTIPSVSSFLSHEYYQDFTYIPIYSDKEFMKFDQNAYTNLGPGSNQGVKLLFPGLKPSERILSYEYLQNLAPEKLKAIGEEKGDTEIFVEWDKEFGEYILSDECNLSLNQIEGALCEFSKYYRILHGTGSPRCPAFEPKTLSGIIVSREDNSQDEFITDTTPQAPKRRGRPSLSSLGVDRPESQVKSLRVITNILEMRKEVSDRIDKLEDTIAKMDAKIDKILSLMDDNSIM